MSTSKIQEISDNIVVDQAEIKCNCARNSTRLMVKGDANGNNVTGPYIIATEKDCKAGKNLFPYKRCYSPYYMETVSMLYGIYSDEYYRHRSLYSDCGYGECFHLLEEVWFQANESVVVTNMYGMEEQLTKTEKINDKSEGDIVRLEPLIKQLKSDIEPLLKEKKGTGYYYDSELSRRLRKRKERLKAAINKILDNLPEIKQKAKTFGYAEEVALTDDEFLDNYKEMRNLVSNLNKDISALIDTDTWDIGFIDINVNLGGASNAINPNAKNPERTPLMIVDDVIKLESYNAVTGITDQLYLNICTIINKIKDWTNNYSRTLTTDSFMVCRCGGVLEFQSSGQEVAEYFQNLYAWTLELVNNTIIRYQSLEETQDLYGETDEKHELKYSYKYAIDGLKTMYTYLSEGEMASGDMQCNVHLEFVAKSLMEDEKNRLTALITVAGLLPLPADVGIAVAGVSLLMTVYDSLTNIILKVTGKDEEWGRDFNLSDAANSTSNLALSANAMRENYLNSMGRTVSDGVQVVSGLSKVLDVFALLTLINYEITDNWIESIRVYVFTDEYMFLSTQFLNAKCEKIGGPGYYPSVERSDYSNIRRGSNVEWGDDPGATYNVSTNIENSKNKLVVPKEGSVYDEMQKTEGYK